MHGNLINRLSENSVIDIPEINQGCTLYYYSDRDSATVIKIKSPSRVLVQEDCVSYNERGYAKSIEQNPDGRILEVIKTKRGWKVLKSDTRVRFGFRDPYFDLAF